MVNKIILIAGPSCIGKTTLLERLHNEKGYEIIKSYTTRLPRNEADSNSMNTIGFALFKSWIDADEMGDWSLHLDNLYGIRKDELFTSNSDKVLTTNLQGLLNIKNKYPDIYETILLPEVPETLYDRIKSLRNDSTDRINKAKEEINAFEKLRQYRKVYIAENDINTKKIDDILFF